MTAFFAVFNGESETVFTTCIYNSMMHGHKIPHIMSRKCHILWTYIFLDIIKTSHKFDEKSVYMSRQ